MSDGGYMSKGRRYATLLALAFLYSSMFLLPYIKYLFYDGMIEATGFTNAQLGLPLTAYTITYMISNFFTGWFADKFPPKRLLVISGLAQGAVNMIYPFFMTSFPATMVIWAYFGFTSTLLFWAPTYKAIRLLGDPSEQGKLYGIFESSNGLASLVVNFGALGLFSLLAKGVFALKGIIYFYGALTIVSSLVILFLYKDPEGVNIRVNVEATEEEKKPLSTKEILSVVKLPQVWLMALLMLGIYGFHVGSSYLTPYSTAVLGLSAVAAGVYANVRTYGFRFVGGPLGSYVTSKRKSPVKGLILLTGATIVLMVIFNIIPSSPEYLIPVMILMSIIMILNSGSKGQAFAPMDEMSIPVGQTGTAIAIISIIGFSVPDMFMHTIFGSLLDTYDVAAYKMIFWIMTGLLVLSFVSATLLVSIKRRQQKAGFES